MSRRLHIIMPMAGDGSRFKKSGWRRPKPIIEISGKPLFRHAVESVIKCARGSTKLSCVVRSGIDGNMIASSVRDYDGFASIYRVPALTAGAAETCMAAGDDILDDDGVLVLDCDLSFASREFENAVRAELSKPAGAASSVLLSFDSSDARYSYAETDDAGNVTRTAEKDPISNNALAGAYFFASGKAFKRAARALLSSLGSEAYISKLYNIIIAAGGRVRITHIDSYKSYGTPEELLTTAMNNRIKIVISDFDGTLADTYYANLASYKKAFEKNGLVLDDETYASAFGLRFDDFMAKAGVADAALKERIHSDKAEQYALRANMITLNKPLAGFIRAMKLRGTVCALATMSSRECLAPAVQRLGIGGLFDTVMTSDDCGSKEEMIRRILKKHSMSPGDALVFEDSDAGCAAAGNVGCKFIKI